MLNLDTNEITPTGGLRQNEAKAMNMSENLLTPSTLSQVDAVVTDANTGGDNQTMAHMRNWMECVRAKNVKTNAPIEAGHSHTIACAMANAAFRTGLRVVYDPKTQQIMAGGQVFKY
jgi:hypothetical protein